MTAQWIWIPERVPSRNELDDMRGATRTFFSKKAGRKVRGDQYHDFKRRFHARVKGYVLAQGIKPAPVPAAVTYVFFEPNRRRDPSNFTSSGQKLIEDSLIACGILLGDGWKHVKDFRFHWECTETRAKKFTGVAVRLADVTVDDRARAISYAKVCRDANLGLG